MKSLSCFSLYATGSETGQKIDSENLQRIDSTNHFKNQSNIQTFEIFEEARKDREEFWAKQAECLHWFRKWDRVLNWNPPYAKWFEGGKLNACYNCLDRHVQSGIRNKLALIWEGERGEERQLTYEDLYREVCSSAMC